MGKNGEKMGEIRPKTCQGGELTKNQLGGAEAEPERGWVQRVARLGRLPLECHPRQQCFEPAALLLQQGVELPVGLAAAQEVYGCHHSAPASRRSGREFLTERLRERGEPANPPSWRTLLTVPLCV